MPRAAPLVSIGMPVYNGERTLSAALASLVAQTHRDFELVISDNSSTDATPSICQSFAATDPRIRYVRQVRNIGAPANFRYVLDQCQGRYFMWAAADDWRSADFLACNLAFLEAHPDHVASCSPVRFEDGNFDSRRMGDASLDGDLAERLCGFFGPWHANGRFYSLMRRTAVANCPVIDASFLGSDWVVVLHLAAQGKLHRLQQGATVLGARGASRGKDIFKLTRTQAMERLLPFLLLARWTWHYARPVPRAAKARLALDLLKLNASAFVMQFVARWR